MPFFAQLMFTSPLLAISTDPYGEQMPILPTLMAISPLPSRVDYCETCHQQRIEKEEHKPYRCDRFLDDKYHELYYRCDVCNRYLTQGKKKEAHKEYKTFFSRSATHHLVCMRCDVCYSSYGAYYEPHNFVLQGDKYVCKDCGYQQ